MTSKWLCTLKAQRYSPYMVSGLLIYGFLLMFYGNMPNSAPLQDISFRNLSDLDFDLSRSLRVKCDSVTGLPIYPFLVMFNSNIWPNSAPLWYIRLQNVSDLEFDLWRSLKVKCDDVIGLSLYAFLLKFNSYIWPNSAPPNEKIQLALNWGSIES